jgi:hypothetical protein
LGTFGRTLGAFGGARAADHVWCFSAFLRSNDLRCIGRFWWAQRSDIGLALAQDRIKGTGFRPGAQERKITQIFTGFLDQLTG